MMGWFKKDGKLPDLLKKSAVDFRFDPDSVKYRLLQSMTNSMQAKSKPHRLKWWHAGATAVFVVFLSATFAFASNSKPGDKLFALNKLGENVILNLPLSAEQKAKVEEHIVTSRMQALDSVKSQIETKKLETVKESDITLTAAVAEISQTKAKLKASGNTAAAANLDAVLNRMQKMAQDHEQIIQNFENETSNAEIKIEIHQHGQQIKNSQRKAKAETED
jgi:hypothetical protein